MPADKRKGGRQKESNEEIDERTDIKITPVYPYADNGGEYTLFLTAQACGLCLQAGGGIEDALAQTERLGSDLHQLVIGDELDRLLKRHIAGGDQRQRFVGTLRAHGINAVTTLISGIFGVPGIALIALLEIL